MDCNDCDLLTWINGVAYCDGYDYGFMPCEHVSDCPRWHIEDDEDDFDDEEAEHLKESEK